MFGTPATIIGIWMRGLLSLAVLGGGIWLLVHWYDDANARVRLPGPSAVDPDGETQIAGEATPTFWRLGFDEQTACLLGGLALLTWSTAGRLFTRRLLRRKDPHGTPEWKGGRAETLRGVDGT